MGLTQEDWQALWLTLQLAAVVTFILLLLGTPLAWWLARTTSPWRIPASAIVALPLVLPPSVLGFYALLVMGPAGPLGKFTEFLGLAPLAFSFPGLVIASVIYSLPFMVQPLSNAFEALGQRPLEVAATLRASPLDTFFSVVIPMSWPGFVTACVLTFAHTLGEFGVVLMIGGNIPGVTRLASVQIYSHVEAFNYAQAHKLAIIMLVLALSVLIALYACKPKTQKRLQAL